MSNESSDTFEYEGQKYKAENGNRGNCNGCAFEEDTESCIWRVPDCIGSARTDGRTIIWVKVEN
jgi:hypothetical protein